MAKKFIVNYLRQHPELSEAWLKMLDEDDKTVLSEREQHTMWRLLTKAGHHEAQMAIAEAFTSDYSILSNYRAVSYVHDVENPEPFLVDSLMAMHNNLKDNKDRDSRELTSMSLLAVGSLGAKDKLNEETKIKSANVLSSYLVTTKDEHIKKDILSSMGNHGGAMLLDNIKPYLASSKDALRQTAYHALRQMEEAEAQETITDNYSKEKNINIKAGAIVVLAKMPYLEKTFNFVKNELNTTNDENIRLTIAGYLGKNIDNNEEAKVLLKELAKKSKSLKTKKEIYKYITP